MVVMPHAWIAKLAANARALGGESGGFFLVESTPLEVNGARFPVNHLLTLGVLGLFDQGELGVQVDVRDGIVLEEETHVPAAQVGIVALNLVHVVSDIVVRLLVAVQFEVILRHGSFRILREHKRQESFGLIILVHDATWFDDAAVQSVFNDFSRLARERRDVEVLLLVKEHTDVIHRHAFKVRQHW